MINRSKISLAAMFALTLITLTCAAAAASWVGGDIGSPPAAGNSSESGGTITVEGSGRLNNSWDDACHFYRTEMGSEEFQMIVRLTSTSGNIRECGVMLSDSDAPNAARYVFGMFSDGGGFEDRRVMTDGQSWDHDRAFYDSLPLWFKLCRHGKKVSCYTSEDGVHWETPGGEQGSYLTDLEGSSLVGLVVTSSDDTVATATFDNLSVGPLDFPYETSWIGDSFGGEYQNGSMPGAVENISVLPDGSKIFAKVQNEGRDVILLDGDGNWICYPTNAGNSGNSEAGIAADDNYVYAGDDHTDRVNINDHLAVPPWIKWKIQEGRLPGGLGIDRSAGLLFVSDLTNDRVRVVQTSDRVETGSFSFTSPGDIAVAPDGTLWIIRSSDNTVHHRSTSGTNLGQLDLNSFSEDVLPAGLGISPVNGDIYVADKGRLQQVHIFDDSGNYQESMGAAYGIYSSYAGTVPGETHDDKLMFPSDVDVDNAGNVYVSSGESGFGCWKLPCAQIRKYNASGTLLWSRSGLEFVDNADADPNDLTSVYTKTHRYAMDYSKSDGEEWNHQAVTLDPFTYPDDPRLTESQATAAVMRRIDGQLFMYVMQMNAGSYVLVYRFESGSEIAIPCGIVKGNVDGSLWIWQDTDKDGKQDAGEIDANAGNSMEDLDVDDEGHIWGIRSRDVVCRLPCGGVSNKHPVYDASVESWSKPGLFGTEDMLRVRYDNEDDILVITGFTPEWPHISDLYHWKTAGSTIAAFGDWLGGAQTLLWSAVPETEPEGPSGPHGDNSLRGLDVEEDYVFAIRNRPAETFVYNKTTGEHAINILPGPEVCNSSGLIDIIHGVRARRRPNGEYLIFAEDNGANMVNLYRWTPGAGSTIYIEAEDYDGQSGVRKVNDGSASGGQKVGYIQNGDWTRYNSVALDGVDSFEAIVASGGSGGTLEIRRDSSTGTLLGSCAVNNTGGWSNWVPVDCSLNASTGSHDLYLKFVGGNGYLFDVDYFTPSSAGGGGVPIGQTIALKANSNGKYVCADLGINSAQPPLVANKSTVGTWEQFEVIDAGGGMVGFRAMANDKYVVAENAPNRPLEADRPGIGAWEKFTWIDNGDGTISLKANANDMYVTANKNLTNTPLQANAPSINLWEKFTWEITSGGGGGGTTVRLNSGGSGVTDWQDDTGGSTWSTSASINTSAANAAPEAVYQTERYGNFGYNFTGLTPNAQHTVRLHFAEIFHQAAGKRIFDVDINGSQALNNYDIYVQAGNARFTAVIEEFSVSANSSGEISVDFVGVVDNAKCSGIEILN